MQVPKLWLLFLSLALLCLGRASARLPRRPESCSSRPTVQPVRPWGRVGGPPEDARPLQSGRGLLLG